MTQAPPGKVCKRCRSEVSADHTTCPYDGWALEDMPPDPLVGKIFFGKYQIESILGRGGMSIVYRAQDVFMLRTVAVKILHNHLVADNSSRQRFQQEAQAAGSLNHPNIMTVHDYGLTSDGQAFLIMECFEGPTLADVLEQEVRIKPERGLRIMRQICDGLDHAHKNGIVHRDLKPSNLCLVKGEDGQEIVKIVDFGIAKMLPESGKQRQQLTQTGQIFGSPLFMSPEQCQGKPLDRRSDLYSLGCLMYEALTGMPPFMGPTAFDTMNMHITENPVPMKKTTPEVQIPPELENPIMRLLEKNPDKRYNTAAELKADLPPLPEELAAGTKVWNPSWYSSIKHNPAARASIVVATVVVAIVVSLLPPFFMWPGPKDDPGTPFEKTRWNLDIWLADRAAELHRFDYARTRLDDAYALAQDLDLQKALVTANMQTRLGSIIQSDPNGHWTEYTGTSIRRVRELVRKIALMHFTKERAFYLGLEKSTDENSRKKQIIESRAGQCELVARELEALRFYPEEEELLKTALRVDTPILDELKPGKQTARKHWRIANLDSQLAECYRHMQYTRPINGLLLEALQINQQNHGKDSADALNSMLQLGQFLRDQTRFKEAKEQLIASIKLAESLYDKAIKADASKPESKSLALDEIDTTQQKKQEATALLIEAYYSYADYLNQDHQSVESDKYFQAGDKLRVGEEKELEDSENVDR